MRIGRSFLPGIFVAGGLLFGWAASARLWTNRVGENIEADAVRADSEYVWVRTPEGRLFRIPIAGLSEDDQAYVRSLSAPPAEAEGATPSPETEGATKTPSAPPSDPAPVSEAEFMRVMRNSCLRCHKASQSLDTLVSARWIVPGQPERSPAFAMLTRHPSAKGRYRAPSEAEQRIIRDFIANWAGPAP